MAATADEVAALPPELQCKPLAEHVYALLNGPDGKYTAIKKKLAGSPKEIAGIERLTLKLRDEVADECEQRPWAIEKRRCVAAAKTHQAFGDCH